MSGSDLRPPSGHVYRVDRKSARRAERRGPLASRSRRARKSNLGLRRVLADPE